jgi:hypothetical protein
MDCELTAAEREFLDSVVRTSGGGLRLTEENFDMAEHLLNLGLLKPRSGDGRLAIHTRHGLELWRELWRSGVMQGETPRWPPIEPVACQPKHPKPTEEAAP